VSSFFPSSLERGPTCFHLAGRPRLHNDESPTTSTAAASLPHPQQFDLDLALSTHPFLTLLDQVAPAPEQFIAAFKEDASKFRCEPRSVLGEMFNGGYLVRLDLKALQSEHSNFSLQVTSTPDLDDKENKHILRARHRLAHALAIYEVSLDELHLTELQVYAAKQAEIEARDTIANQVKGNLNRSVHFSLTPFSVCSFLASSTTSLSLTQ
jgi:hypothetical protein